MGLYGQMNGRPGTEVAYVDVSTEYAWRTGAKFAFLAWRYPDHTTERAQRNHSGRERSRNLLIQLPPKKEWRRKTIRQESEAGHDARPSPASMSNLQKFDLQNVSGFCVFTPDRTSQRVNLISIALEKIR